MVYSSTMSEKERGRLFPIRVDGTESVPFFIKRDKVTFGRGDNCDIRVYVDGVESEHCTVLFNREGEGFLDPLNKCGLTFLNGDVIEKEVNLYHNDVITIVKRSFRFLYPSSSSFCVRSHQSAPSLEDSMLQDFIGAGSEKIKQREICQKRVTFGPTLSPEEFDKNLPPASPVRKGSLPGEKNSTNMRLSFKRNLFEDANADTVENDAESPKINVPTSTIALQRLPRMGCSSNDNTVDQLNIDLNRSRPLFSEVLKKCPKEHKKDLNVNKFIQKSSPRRLQKKTPVLQSSKQLADKSARHPRILAVGSTGHANSPETIIVCKKKSPCESVYRYSNQPDKLETEEKLKSPSSCSSITSDGKNNEYSQRSEDDLSLPALRNYCKHNCPSIDRNCILKNTEKNDQERESACSCASSKLSKVEENLNIFNREENVSAGQRIASELLSTSAAEDGEDQSTEQNNFLQDNAMQQLYSHSSISPAFNDESFLNICMNALKKLALTISMMSAFHMYNKVMEDMSNYSMYFPSTSFDSCNIKCDHESNSHQNEGQMDIAKLAWFQDMMQNFFSNSVCNKGFEEERCMLRSCKSNVNSDTSSLCHRKMKNSNIVSTAPFNTVVSGCSPSKCKTICSHDNSVWRKENNETVDESNLAIKNPCYQDSSKTSRLQCLIKSSQISETSLNSSSSTSEYNPSYLAISSIYNIPTDELSEYSNVTQKENVNSKESDVTLASFEKLNSVHNSFSDVSVKKNCMQLNRKSLPPTNFKRGKMSSKTISLIKDPSSENSLSENSICKKLRSRNLVTVKTKQRKSSLGVKKIGIASSRRFRAKKRESCKTRSDFVEFSQDQSLNDCEQLQHFRIKKAQKLKRRLEDDSVIPRITRATVKEKNVVVSKSALKVTSLIEKEADCEIAKGKNFEQVEMEANKKVQAMRKNLRKSSLTSKRITRTATRKRNVKNVPGTLDIIETVGETPESTAVPIKRRKNKSIKRKEPCTTDRSELPKKRVLRLPCDSENSRKRIANNDENDISMDGACVIGTPKRSGKKNKTVKKKQNHKTAASRSEESKSNMLKFHCDSGNRRKRRIASDDETDHKNISMKEKNKNNPRKVKGNVVEISPIQRITRSMVQKRKRREK